MKEENELKESPSIRKIRGKRNTSLVATGDHRRDKEGNIKASFYKKKPAPQGEKSGEHIPVLNWKGKENKSARYGSQLHRLRPRSERLGKKKLKEDAPTMSMGGGGIAGSVEAGDDPPVGKKKKNIYMGLHSRKRWLDFINGKGSGKS